MWNRIAHRCLPVLALLIVGGIAHAQTGRVTGRVTDSSSARPLQGVEVVVVQEGGVVRTGGRTDQDGRYTIPNVGGQLRLRARLIGFVSKERVVTMRPGETMTADFALVARSVVLDQVVVTGTGGAVERRSVGNVIETIDAQSVMQVAAPRSVEQLIGARTPGVIILPSTGQVGTGAQIRVRAVGSLSLSTDPIVYVDGVRMDADAAQGPSQRGGAGASRLNDINPEDIESIEIIKGPAAATLYGTEASNGVVQIITKRGKSGAAKWDFSTRQGTNWLANPVGRAGELWYKDSTGAVKSFNLYQREIDQGHGPIFTDGRNHGYAAGLTGGTDATRYYLSSTLDRDIGVVPWNWENKVGTRANIDVEPTRTLRLQGSLGYVRDRIRLAQPGEINPDPFSNLVWGRYGLIPTTGGFGFAPRDIWDDVENHADNDRATTSITANFQPFSWFTHRLAVGLDASSENNWTLYPRETAANATYYGASGLGSKSVDRTTRNFLTLDYTGNLKYSFRANYDFTTSFGFQSYRSEINGVTASGTTFPASPITVVSGTTTRNATENYVANATVGMYAQQQVAWKNRLFLTVALRGDDNSAFGKDYSAAYYPKISGSWVLSEEPFWTDKLRPISRLIGDLRLRGAFGAAGTQPGTFDASRLYAAYPGYQNAAGLVPSSFGNPQLKPERSTELELGFESTLLRGRMDVQYTHFGRNVTDAIVNVGLAPSLGFPGSQVVNIGRVKAWGNELAANMRVVEGRRFAWELGTQLANNGNRIIDMGGQNGLATGGGGVAQNRVGYGIADFFMYSVRSGKMDSKGTVTSAVCDGGTGSDGLAAGGPDAPCPIGTFTGTPAPRVFLGHSQPTWQAGLNTQVTLWDNLRLYARADGNGGHYQSDTEVRALHNQGSSHATVANDDPILNTYRQMGESDRPGTYKAGFLKLRELSATYTLKPSWLRTVRATSGSISIAGRNLSMLWTAQEGWGTSRDGEVYTDIANGHVWDPETRAVGSRSSGFQTILPPTQSFVASLRLTY